MDDVANAVPDPREAVTGVPSVPEQLAAVDLGSNSFHLVIGRVVDGHLDVVDRLREPVRLAAGLDEHKRLRRDAVGAGRSRVCTGSVSGCAACPDSRCARSAPIRCAAPATVKCSVARRSARSVMQSRSSQAARKRASSTWGWRTRTPTTANGASSSTLAGEARNASSGAVSGRCTGESLYMGCVSISRKYFPGGRVDKHSMKRAVLAARVELEPIERPFRDAGWSSAVGASGTIRAIAGIAHSGRLVRGRHRSSGAAPPAQIAGPGPQRRCDQAQGAER